MTLTVHQALTMLPDGDMVHTFLDGGGVALGADWPRDKVVALITEAVTLRPANGLVRAMGHGLVVTREDGGRVFVATRRERP